MLQESIAPGETAWTEEPEPTPEGMDVYSPACSLNDVIYFFGASGLLSFEPVSKKWTALPSPPDLEGTIASPAVAAHKGRVWVMGGTSSPEHENRFGKNRINAFAYDPQGQPGQEWSRGPDLPASVAWGASWSANEKLLVISGGRWQEDQSVHAFGAKDAFFAPFLYKNDHVTKTGSEQTQGKYSKEMRFSQAASSLMSAWTGSPATRGTL